MPETTLIRWLIAGLALIDQLLSRVGMMRSLAICGSVGLSNLPFLSHSVSRIAINKPGDANLHYTNCIDGSHYGFLNALLVSSRNQFGSGKRCEFFQCLREPKPQDT